MEHGNPLPALSAEEYASLEASIARDGITYPIIKSAGPACFGQIVDGFNRAEIARKLGLTDVPIISKRYETEAEFRLAQIDLNANRRQLTPYQRVVLGMAREPWEKKLASQRRGVAVTEPDAAAPVGRATEITAKAVGLSRKTYENAKFVIDKGPEEVKRLLAENKIPIDRAFKQTREALGLTNRDIAAKAISQKLGTMPSGTFDSVVIDPPWRGARELGGTNVSAPEIAALPISSLLKDVGIAYLWTPIRNVAEAVSLLNGWGLSVAGAIHWVHDKAERGQLLHEKAELCLVGVRGRIVPVTQYPLNVVTGKAEEGRRLPRSFFSLVDGIREGEQLLMFGSTDRERWTGWTPGEKKDHAAA